jgi:DNA polymerase-3 subunit chi
MTRVDFYVLESADARERLKFACRVIDKAFAAEQRVLVCFDSDGDATSFDDLLWTFAQDSFVPHELLNADSDWEETPVLLSAGQPARSAPDVVVNLGTAVPASAQSATAVIEIVDADAARRQAGRLRYKQYKELGVEPVTHKLGEAQDSGA